MCIADPTNDPQPGDSKQVLWTKILQRIRFFGFGSGVPSTECSCAPDEVPVILRKILNQLCSS